VGVLLVVNPLLPFPKRTWLVEKFVLPVPPFPTVRAVPNVKLCKELVPEALNPTEELIAPWALIYPLVVILPKDPNPEDEILGAIIGLSEFILFPS